MRYFNFIWVIVFLASCNAKRETTLNHNFYFTRPTLGSIDSIEAGNLGISLFKSYTITVAGDYFPDANTFRLGQPLIYLRDTGTLNTMVSYYFSQPDSLLRLIEYSWNASSGESNKLERLYSYNKEWISRLLKQPGNETLEKHDTWSQKTIIWQTDSVYVKQFMVIQGSPSRTRVLISWKGF
jgi:hypothetical protein